MAKIKTADDYIRAQTEQHQTHLALLREVIQSIIPEAEEQISYGIIAYQYHYMLVGIGTKKDACSLYTMNPEMLSSMEKELEGLKYSGSTLYFPLDKELNTYVVERIVQERVQENEFRAIANGKI